MTRISTCIVVLLASVASAQDAAPSVAPARLNIVRAPKNTSSKELEELRTDFLRLLRKSGANLPDSATLEVARKDLKRDDCDRDDDCLKQLAAFAHTLYGIYVEVDFTLSGAVVASGRIVRDDGKLIAPLKSVTIPKGNDAFNDIARVAITRLLEELGMARLAPTKPTPTAVEVVPPPTLDTPPPTPPLVVVETTSTGRIVSYTIGALAVIALATGFGLLISGQLDAARVPVNANNIFLGPPNAESSDIAAGIRTKRTIGTAVTAVGAAAAATAIILFFVSPAVDSGPSAKPLALVAPSEHGAGVVFQWRLP